MYSHKTTQYPCEYCGQVFQTKSGRAKHYRKHQNQDDVKNFEVFEMKEISDDQRDDENELMV